MGPTNQKTGTYPYVSVSNSVSILKILKRDNTWLLRKCCKASLFVGGFGSGGGHEFNNS